MKSIVSTCLASLVTSPAWSAVILSGVVDLPIATTLDGMYLDLDSASAVPVDDELNNSQVNFFFGGDGVISSDRFLPARLGVQSSDPVRNLPVAAVVSDSLFFSSPQFGTSMMHIGAAAGQFENGTEGYLGFKFDRLDDGNFTFGWMRVTLTNGSGEGTIHEWAYSDTPGELIEVGGTVIIPEPTSGMLFLLASGGMVLLRRRA